MTDFPRDFLNQPIVPGRKVVYARSVGSSAPDLVLATVEDVTKAGEDRWGTEGDFWRIKVKRIRDHHGAMRTDDTYRNANRVITLSEPKRVLVVHPDAA